MSATPIEPQPASASLDASAERCIGASQSARLALSAEQDSLAALVAEHQAAVRQLVYRLLAWSDGGEDVVQEVFLEAWRLRQKLAGLANVELWLKRIAINKCRSRQRRVAVRRRWLSWFYAQDPVQHVCPGDTLEQQEQVSQIRHAVAQLDGRYREVVVLHYLELQSIENIATLTGTRRGTVEVRLHRARQLLEKSLADLA